MFSTDRAADLQPEDARRDVAIATRILARHGLLGMYGHVSALMSVESGRFALGPGAGSRKDRCRPEDVFELDVDDDWRPGLPLELYMHSEGHRRERQVGSMVHIHAPALTQLSSLTEVPTDVLLFNGSFWPDPVPVFDRPDLVRDRVLGRELAELVATSPLVLMRWHGAVVVAGSVREAVFRSIFAEENARLMLGAFAHDQPTVSLPPAERQAAYERIVNDRLLGLHWGFEGSWVTQGEPDDGA